MGSLYSKEHGFNWESIKYPTLPEAPYLTLNSAMVFLSSCFLGANLGFIFKNFKDLPQKVPLKFVPDQKRFVFNLNKKFIFLLPLTGIYAIGQGILFAANTHLIPYPINFSQENKQKADDLMGSFVYFGVLLSQVSLFQNSLRMMFPDKIGSTWFKSFYGALTVGSLAGYGIVGYYFYKIILDQQARNKAEKMFTR